MLESISQIKDKVHSSMYETEGRKTYDVDSIVAELKGDDKFKNFKESELYSYAYGLIANHNAHALKGAFQSMGFDTGKPQDPFWGQYTYEEILNMVNDGVLVPQEFIDWAYTMQDSDTTAYQIEDSSEDPNTYDNLAGETGNIDQSDIQKRAQAFASQAQAQEKLINDKVEETKPILNTVLAEKNELEKNQKSALENLASMTKEWKTLDRKFKSGTPLSEAEQNKYQELGLALNDSNNGIILQTKKVSDDIEELMTQIDSIDMLLGVNEKINAEIEDIGTRMSWFEGNKKHIILPTSKGNQVTGLSAAFYVAAMGNNLAYDTGLAGVNLFFNNMEVQHQQEININTAIQTQKQVDVVNNATDNQDDNLKYTTNKQSENKNDDNKTEQNNNPQNGVQQPETDANETINPEKPQPKTTQADTKVPAQAEEPLISQEEPENTLTKALNSENNPKTNAINAQFNSNVAENADKAQTPEVSTDKTAQTSVQAAQTSETEGAEATATADEAGEVTETPDTSVETEDPLKAETSQMVSECENRNNAMVQAEQQIQGKVEEVKKIRANKSKDDAQLKNELTKAVSEYDKLAQKVQNGETLSDNEQKRVKALEKDINAKNGTIITKIKDKVTALTGFANALNNDIQQTKVNQEFGEQTVAKGKEYAKATLGDREYLKDSMFGIIPFEHLPKEKQYDLLYGKKGESLGRDAIDNGELLISNAAASHERLAKSLPLAGFAMNYAQELNTNISETNQKVNAIKDNLSNSIQSNSASSDNDAHADNSTKNKEKDDLDKNDAQDIKKRGNKIKQEGKEVQRDGVTAKREKTKTDKDSKKEVNNLKKTAAQIAKMNAENAELNRSIESMNAEAELLNEDLQTASNEGSEEPTPVNETLSSMSNTRAVHSSNSVQTNPVAQQSGDVSTKVERLQAISTQSMLASNKINLNNKSITVMSKTSSKKVKQLQKMSAQRHKYYQNQSKKATESEQENSKFQEKVNSSAKIFTGIMATGLALMLLPWTHAIGTFMFRTGAYGTVACYLTNSAIYAANGNLKGALINFGAAALSFFAAGSSVIVANGAVTQLAAYAGTSVAATSTVIAGTQVGAIALQKAADKPFRGSDDNTKVQKKGRRLVSYQEKRARQAKMDKIERTIRILTSRGQKKR